jgi:hypothetical protein
MLLDSWVSDMFYTKDSFIDLKNGISLIGVPSTKNNIALFTVEFSLDPDE